MLCYNGIRVCYVVVTRPGGSRACRIGREKGFSLPFVVSATTRTFGPCSGDLDVDLGFGQSRLEGSELARGREQLIDLALTQGLAQQPREGLIAKEPCSLCFLGEIIRQADSDGGQGGASRKLGANGASGDERFEPQALGGAEVLHVGGEERQVMLDGGGGDQSIGQAHAVDKASASIKSAAHCEIAGVRGSTSV